MCEKLPAIREPFHVPAIKEPVPHCPVCGIELENVYLTEDDCLLYIDESEILPLYCTEIGLFKLTPDDERPYLDHIEFHHTHE